ncbi:MAG: DegT/DnrJ/EryC1/StrS family aminotransferase [bacterium]
MDITVKTLQKQIPISKLTWWEPQFTEEDVKAVADVIRNGFVNEGKKTAELTQRMQKFFNVAYVLATCSGTIALYLALKACGVEERDEVLVPDLTFIATANAVILCGAKPILVNIRLSDLNIDPNQLKSSITKRTKAILPVHINGRCADMDAIQSVTKEYNLAVIEDAAQGLGSSYKGKYLGTFGDAGCISLAPTKIITSAQGGLIFTNRQDIYEKVVRLKDHGRLSRSWNYHPEIGFNFKFSDIYAALTNAQFNYLPGRLEKAKHDWTLYYNALADLPTVTFIETDFEKGTVPLWVDALVEDREGLIESLKTQGIDCRPFWPAIHTQTPYHQDGDFSNAAYAAEHGIWFPSGAGKTDEDIQYVINAVRKYYGKK